MAADFRFGVSLRAEGGRMRILDSARRAQDMGYDVLLVRDHLDSPAPLAVLAAVAAVTETAHLGTFVLNAGFHSPALLARDAATLWELTDGRFELGLGTGFVRAEFEAAGIPFPSAGQRVDHLRRVVDHLDEHVPEVPLLIAGHGDRVLTIAATRARIVGLTGRAPEAERDPLAERIAFVRNVADEHTDRLEFNLTITAMPVDRTGTPDLSFTRRLIPDRSDEELLGVPGVLSGSTEDVADQIRRYRDVYGITYFTLQQSQAERFATVIGRLS